MKIQNIWYARASDTTLGHLWTAASDNGLVAVRIGGTAEDFCNEVRRLTGCEPVYDAERLADIMAQLGEYLRGQRREFTMPIDWSVLKPFQQQVLRITREIAYGSQRIYGDIAQQLGKPNAARAVGRALATNPMAFVIPCHRVIGKDGKLHGYAAPEGIKTKAWLLEMEGAAL